MAFFPNKPADSDEIRLGAKQIRDNFDGVVNDGIVIPKPPLYGAGSPAANLGRAGECYIDTRTGNQYLKNPSGKWEVKLSLDAPVERVQVLGNRSGNIGINGATGNIITLAVTGALTIMLIAGTSGYCRVLTLIMTNGGSHTITWPTSVKWSGRTAPILTAAGRDIITLITTDDGTSWLGMQGGNAFV